MKNMWTGTTESWIEKTVYSIFTWMVSTRVGQARITLNGDSAEIGYSICEEMRSRGYGQKLLALISEKVLKEFPDISTIFGEVKPENYASQKCIPACWIYRNLSCFSNGKRWGTWEMIYIRADMNMQIATGHMMRCLSIADALSSMEKKCDIYPCR